MAGVTVWEVQVANLGEGGPFARRDAVGSNPTTLNKIVTIMEEGNLVLEIS